MHCCTPKCSIITVVVGSVLCIGSGLLLFFLPDMIPNIVASQIKLSTSSVTFDMWENIPIQVSRKIFLFNYTNADDFSSGVDPKPIAVQIGPYVYKYWRNKLFVDWESNGEYVNYWEKHTYNFSPEDSVGSEDDIVITPNVPLAGIIATIERMTKAEAKAAIAAMNGIINGVDWEKAFVHAPIGRLLFYGYHDPVLEKAQLATKEELIPGAMYGMFYGRNATDDGHYEIHRGYEDIKEVYKIHKWNESTSIELWSMDRNPDNGCNMFNGTDGSFYWPGIKRSDRVTIFISDICRNIFADYEEDLEYSGISGYRYGSTMALFADPNMNPDNDCYCSPGAETCIASGVTDLGPCKFGAPIYLSHPHFLYTDHAIKDNIIGLAPNEDEHRTFILIEPNSGNLMEIDVRFQINVLLTNVQGIDVLSKLPNSTLLPVIWVNEHTQLDSERVDLINHSMFMPMNAIYGVTYALIALTGFLICLGVSCSYNLMFRFRKHAGHGGLRNPYEHHNYGETNIPRVKHHGGSSKYHDQY